MDVANHHSIFMSMKIKTDLKSIYKKYIYFIITDIELNLFFSVENSELLQKVRAVALVHVVWALHVAH